MKYVELTRFDRELDLRSHIRAVEVEHHTLSNSEAPNKEERLKQLEERHAELLKGLEKVDK